MMKHGEEGIGLWRCVCGTEGEEEEEEEGGRSDNEGKTTEIFIYE